MTTGKNYTTSIWMNGSTYPVGYTSSTFNVLAWLYDANNLSYLLGKTVNFTITSTGASIGSNTTQTQNSICGPYYCAYVPYTLPSNAAPGSFSTYFTASFPGDSSYCPVSTTASLDVAHNTQFSFTVTPTTARGTSPRGYPIAYPGDAVTVIGNLYYSPNNSSPPSTGFSGQTLFFLKQGDTGYTIVVTSGSSGTGWFGFTAPAISQNVSAITDSECDYYVSGGYWGYKSSTTPPDYYAASPNWNNIPASVYPVNIALGMPTTINPFAVYNSGGTNIASIKKGTKVYIKGTLKTTTTGSRIGSKTLYFRDESNLVDLGTAVTNSNGVASYAWTPTTSGCYTLSSRFYSTGNYCGVSASYILFKVCDTANTCTIPGCP